VTRERDRNPHHVLQLLRNIVEQCRREGVEVISVDALDEAIRLIEARRG
jgi:thiamine monophosphate synthase